VISERCSVFLEDFRPAASGLYFLDWRLDEQLKLKRGLEELRRRLFKSFGERN